MESHPIDAGSSRPERGGTAKPGLRVVQIAAIGVGVLLCAMGAIHDVVNVRSLQRAAARGDVAERLVPQLMANTVASGVALALPGIVLILIRRDLAGGQIRAWRTALAIGLFFVLAGVAGYVWRPIAGVLIFSLLGALISVPLLVWRKSFYGE